MSPGAHAPAPVTVVIVPGLRDAAPMHWQTLLAERLSRVVTVPPMGRENLDCRARVQAIEHAVAGVGGPVVIVAHSGGCITVAHWAGQTQRAGAVRGALLATPPDFDTPLPAGYPSPEALRLGGWLPVPRWPLPFRSTVAASRNDPLGAFGRMAALAGDWGSTLVDLGEVAHLNPASGFGNWPLADRLIAQLAADTAEIAAPPA